MTGVLLSWPMDGSIPETDRFTFKLKFPIQNFRVTKVCPFVFSLYTHTFAYLYVFANESLIYDGSFSTCEELKGLAEGEAFSTNNGRLVTVVWPV